MLRAASCAIIFTQYSLLRPLPIPVRSPVPTKARSTVTPVTPTLTATRSISQRNLRMEASR